MTKLLLPIATIILLAINAIFGLLLINLSQESQISRSHLEALKLNRQNQEKLQADLLSYQTQIDQLYKVLPTENQLPEFIQFVTDTGNKQGINLVLNFTTNQPTKTKENLYLIPFVVSTQTDPKKLPDLIAALHSGLYQIRLKNIEVLPSVSPASTIKLSGDVYVAGPI